MSALALPTRDYSPAVPRPAAQQRPWHHGTRGMATGAFGQLLPPEVFAARLAAAQQAAGAGIAWFFDPHPAQQLILDCPARFESVRAGRRFGKGVVATRWLTERAIERPDEMTWWIAPTYQTSLHGGWTTMIKSLPRPERRVLKADRRIELTRGGQIEYKSADQPDNLRGEGLAALVIDEAAYIDDYVWDEVLRPMLMTTNGRVLMISTPRRRRGFFYETCRAGERGEHDVANFHFPSSSNPFVPASEIELLRRTMPEIAFAREILAEFVEDLACPLARVAEIATALRATPLAGHRYVAGIDWGRRHDYTVVSVMEQLDDGRARQVELDRFTGLRYSDQLARVATLLRLWQPHTVVGETNNMGGPLVEWLEEAAFPMAPWAMGANKAELIDQFQLAIEQQTIELLADPILIGECQDYEETETATLRRAFSAPSRQHDDTVVATALSVRGAHGAPGSGRYTGFDHALDAYLVRGNQTPGLPGYYRGGMRWGQPLAELVTLALSSPSAGVSKGHLDAYLDQLRRAA